MMIMISNLNKLISHFTIFFVISISTSICSLILIIACLGIFTQTSYGINEKTDGGFWTWKASSLKASLHLPLIALQKTVSMPQSIIHSRALLFEADQRIEPLYASLSNPYEKSIANFAKKFSKNDDYIIPLEEYLITKPAGIYLSKRQKKNRKQFLRVILNPLAMSFIDIDKFQQKYSTTSYDLILQSKKFRWNNKQKDLLLEQVSTYLEAHSLSKLKHYINSETNIDVSTLLLPEFASRVLNKYVVYRGPNCFHAAMGFQDKSLLTMTRTNIRIEPNHHHLMINHDELLRIVNWYFYEIDPKKNPLRYGDVIMFLDVPEDSIENQPAQFDWIVHASAYLFGDFVFSKGSKSPNSPYTIKTIDEEWQTWKKLSSNLAIKVFRKSFDNFKQKSTVVSRSSWLY